jgi:hypothetical protein
VDIATMLGYSSTAVTQAAKRGEVILAADRNLEMMLGESKKTLTIRMSPLERTIECPGSNNTTNWATKSFDLTFGLGYIGGVLSNGWPLYVHFSL